MGSKLSSKKNGQNAVNNNNGYEIYETVTPIVYSPAGNPQMSYYPSYQPARQHHRHHHQQHKQVRISNNQNPVQPQQVLAN